MKIRILKEKAGMAVGFETEAPDNIAKTLIDKGIAEEVKALKKIVKEESAELDTKEDKIVGKRKTKSKK
jgi:hypothetical protein